MMLNLPPDLIAAQFGPRSRLPDAVVCLHDAELMLAEAQYALEQAVAHEHFPAKDDDLLLINFYAIDVALRLYAAGEHVADAIVITMDLDEVALRAFAREQHEQKRVDSRQAVVGLFINAEQKGHPVSKATAALNRNRSWKRAMVYRNLWVHKQGPLLQVMGVVWKRGNRWKEYKKGFCKLNVGSGDRPEINVEELVTVMKGALAAFATATESVVGWLYTRLGELKAEQKEKRLAQRSAARSRCPHVVPSTC
jgi:hypothetical protein